MFETLIYDQKILELFLQEGYYQRHLNKMRGIYKGKHDFLLKYLREEMSQICQVSGEYAGVHLLLTFCNGLTEQEAVIRAKAAGILVYGLSEYCVYGNPNTSCKVLLGYACMREEELSQAVKTLKKVWEKK